MARLIRSPRAKRDIVETLEYTKQRWGVDQAREYAALIQDALTSIAADPRRGKPRDDVRPGIWARHISQRGRPARHILFYRISPTGTVEIVRFLHDAMDFAQHLPST
jgi:toxin ParE1/3/4